MHTQRSSSALLIVAVTLGALAFSGACQRAQNAVEQVQKSSGKVHMTKSPPRSQEQMALDQAVLQAQADNALLKRQLEKGVDKRTGIINAHEHLYHVDDLEKYLPAARATGIVKTVMLSSSALTLAGKGGDPGEPSMSQNFEDEVLPAAKKYPDEIIPFCTLDPLDKNALETLKKHVKMGAKGLKLFSGHSNFYNRPLDAPELDPVYSYLEETQLPVLWHVDYYKFHDELDHVMDKHPKMNLVMPHYGVCFWRPHDGCIERLTELLRKHPNIFVDTSLGTRQILTDGFGAMGPQLETYRKFIDEFQDRIVWGTDTVVTQHPEKTPAWFEDVFFAARDQLEKTEFTTPLGAAWSKYSGKAMDGDGKYLGFGLPPEILQKIYSDNPKRWLHLQ